MLEVERVPEDVRQRSVQVEILIGQGGRHDQLLGVEHLHLIRRAPVRVACRLLDRLGLGRIGDRPGLGVDVLHLPGERGG